MAIAQIKFRLLNGLQIKIVRLNLNLKEPFGWKIQGIDLKNFALEKYY